MYSGGIPDPEKVGFIQINAIGHGDDFTEDIESLCQILQRQSYWVDADGYEHEITAASVDKERHRYAWVEYKSKELCQTVDVDFYLNVIIDGRLIIEWEIETYNPYFGCQVEFLQWAGDYLVLIYHEKHDTYICSFVAQPLEVTQPLIKHPIARHKLADEWLIREGTVIYRSETVDRVERVALPDLRPLESWSADHARSIGALPPDYDEMNEIQRKYQKP